MLFVFHFWDIFFHSFLTLLLTTFVETLTTRWREALALMVRNQSDVWSVRHVASWCVNATVQLGCQLHGTFWWLSDVHLLRANPDVPPTRLSFPSLTLAICVWSNHSPPRAFCRLSPLLSSLHSSSCTAWWLCVRWHALVRHLSRGHCIRVCVHTHARTPVIQMSLGRVLAVC